MFQMNTKWVSIGIVMTNANPHLDKIAATERGGSRGFLDVGGWFFRCNFLLGDLALSDGWWCLLGR